MSAIPPTVASPAVPAKGERSAAGGDETIEFQPRHHYLGIPIGAQHGERGVRPANAEFERRSLAFLERARIGELHVAEAAANRAQAQAVERLRHETAGERERHEAEGDDAAGDQAAAASARDSGPGEGQAVHAASISMAPSCRAMTRAARSTTRGS